MWAVTCRVGPACPWHLTSSAPLSPKAAATHWHREVTCLSRGHMLRKRPVAQGHADQQATLSSPTQRSLWPGRGIKRYLSLRLVGTLLGGRESPGTPGKAWRRENSGRTAAASSGRDSGPQNAPGPGPKGVRGCWRSWKDRTRPQRALWWDARSQTRRPYTGPEPPLRLSQFAGFCFHCKRNIYPGPSSWHVWLEWKTPSSVRPLVWCLGSAACLPPGVTGGQARPGASHTCGKPRVLLVGTGRDLGAAELAARAP